MKHYAYDEWVKYVKNEISAVDRDELEGHLYTCDQCLDAYLLVVAQNESSLPLLSGKTSFTDHVMAEISTVKEATPVPIICAQPESQTKKGKPFYQEAFFHYMLAAVATILLTFTGTFQSLVKYAYSIENQDIQKKRPSVTEGVINKTFAWMDALEKKEAVKK